MSAKDRFSYDLKCPECGREGRADFWEEDGYRFMQDSTTHIDSLSEGFRSVEAPSTVSQKLDIQCIDHPVTALRR